MFSKRLIFVAAILGSAAMQQLKANTTYNFTATDSGWYNNTGANADGTVGPSDVNYFAGGFNGNTYNDFFIFNISGLSGNILSATLTLENPDPSAVVGGPSTFNIGSVTDSAATVGSASASTTVFNDLAGGTLFSQLAGISGAAGNVVLNFNGTGLTALGLAGSGFVLGGYLTSPGGTQYLFTNDPDGLSGETLSITTDASQGPAPEPASFVLLGSGLLGLGFLARRRASR